MTFASMPCTDHFEREQHVGHHPHDRGAVHEARRRQVRHDEGKRFLSPVILRDAMLM